MIANHSEIKEILLDINRDPLADYRTVLFGYITPIFFLITLAANVMIVLVLSRPTMRSPTNLVLLSMAVADLLTLVFPVPWYFYMYTLGYYRCYLYPAISCNLYNVMVEILPTFFHTASIWCTLLLACQRYIYICHPTLAKVWCTTGRVARTIFAIFVLASIHQLLRFFEKYYESTVIQIPIVANNIDDYHYNINCGTFDNENDFVMQKACRLVQAQWIKSIEDLYFGTYYVFRIFFVHIGPCLLLVIFNVLLYNALKQAEITRNKLLNKKQDLSHHNQRNGSGLSRTSQDNKRFCGGIIGGSSSTGGSAKESTTTTSSTRKTNRGRDANSTTVMLIVVVTVFLTVEIPLAVATAVHVFENMFNIDIVSDRFLYMTIIFSNFFIIISYPVNFAIYCGMSRAFRETFQQMFLKKLLTLRGTGTGGTCGGDTASSLTPPHATLSTNTNTHTHSTQIMDRSAVTKESDSPQAIQKTKTMTTTTTNTTINPSSTTNNNNNNNTAADKMMSKCNEENQIIGNRMVSNIITGNSISNNTTTGGELAITDHNGQTRMVANHSIEIMEQMNETKETMV